MCNNKYYKEIFRRKHQYVSEIFHVCVSFLISVVWSKRWLDCENWSIILCNKEGIHSSIQARYSISAQVQAVLCNSVPPNIVIATRQLCVLVTVFVRCACLSVCVCACVCACVCEGELVRVCACIELCKSIIFVCIMSISLMILWFGGSALNEGWTWNFFLLL